MAFVLRWMKRCSRFVGKIYGAVNVWKCLCDPICVFGGRAGYDKCLGVFTLLDFVL